MLRRVRLWHNAVDHLSMGWVVWLRPTPPSHTRAAAPDGGDAGAETSTRLGKRRIVLTLDATLIFSGSAKFIAESNVN